MMIEEVELVDRRKFLQAGAAAASLPLLGGALDLAPGHASAAQSAKIDYHKVLFSADHPAAAVFGRAARAGGLPVQAIGGDVTALWYDDLYHRWRRGPAAIAGLTTQPVAFCLELFAQDAGMRMVLRGEHQPTADGGLTHRITAPASVLARAALMDRGTSWPQGVAELIGACPADLSSKSSISLSSAPAAGSAFDEPLVSWVMAPVSRA